MPNTTHEVLTVQDVAGELRCGPSTVYRLISSGRLPAIRLGAGRGGIRISRTALLSFINGGEVAA